MQSLQSILAEQSIMSQLNSHGDICTFELSTLEDIAHDTLPSKRVAKAFSYLQEVYGHRPIPPAEYLDKVFGIDVIVEYRGWRLALDITLNPDAIASKSEKLTNYRQSWQRLGCDAAGVINANQPLKPQLSAIIRSAR